MTSLEHGGAGYQGLLAGIEAGGTKFVCAVGAAPDRIVREARILTTTPAETIGRSLAFFAAARIAHGAITSLGIASFGPVGVTPGRAGWGRILNTPKPGWSGADLAGAFARALICPVAIDTDVNAAALAEYRLGAGRGCGTMAYVTVGTGIGAGILVDGRPIHGRLHPEFGHLRPRRHPDEQSPGVCPFHGDCFEGLASGSAVAARFGAALSELPPDHPAWAIEADYLAQLCAALVLAVSPERIVLGGGVMQQERLFPAIRARLGLWLGLYPGADDGQTIDDGFIVPPALGARSGVIGALILAETLRNSG